MKFMMNGALTVGTLDGANVEMHERAGRREHVPLRPAEPTRWPRMKAEGYVPQRFYSRDPILRRALDQMKAGFRDGMHL